MEVLTKQHILAEIRRTAEANGGLPLGRTAFLKVTGIREIDWRGRYWSKWGEAISEAGYTPNELNPKTDKTLLFQRVIELTSQLGHFPTQAELQIAKRNDATFPSKDVIEKLGVKRQRMLLLLQFCEENGNPEPATSILRSSVPAPIDEETPVDGKVLQGFVYMLRVGKHYKIGRTNDLTRRTGELGIQLPERADFVHSIRTDDMIGIEAYWHQRFADRRLNGEWFSLTASDVRAFKSRKSM